jgi:hypothetical protein
MTEKEQIEFLGNQRIFNQRLEDRLNPALDALKLVMINLESDELDWQENYLGTLTLAYEQIERIKQFNAKVYEELSKQIEELSELLVSKELNDV